MRRRRISELLLARLPQPGDEDRGSIAFLMLAILISVSLGGLIMAMVISQNQTTRFDNSRVHSLDAAQAGIDLVLGQIRATGNATTGIGDDGGLPCGPFSGSADTTGAGAYSVSLVYYLTDPSVAGATKMTTCVPNYGPYFAPPANTRTPRYAVITSSGNDGSSGNGRSKGRTLVTTYVFQTDDTDIAGGVIRIFPDSSGNLWCMDLGSATPTAGTPVLLRSCSTSNPPSPQQTLAYRSDLSIQLVSSVTSTYPAGLCLDTNAAGNPTSHKVGDPLVLAPCAIADPSKCTDMTKCSPWNQQWSVDDSAHLEGAKTDQSGLDGLCINAAAQSNGQALSLQTCAGGVTDTAQTWVPSPTTGAGMANNPVSGGGSQIVNFQQFATCIDVTGQDPTSTFLILYTCKQSPTGTPAWNQVFTAVPAVAAAPTKTLLETTDAGTTYCLWSPETAGGYVVVKTPCPTKVSTASSNFVWTVNTTQDASGNDLPYGSKYTISDGSSTAMCLGPGLNSDLLNGQYLKLVVGSCNGGTGQKWNASPSLDQARLTNTKEN
jgi:hypothetical protein